MTEKPSYTSIEYETVVNKIKNEVSLARSLGLTRNLEIREKWYRVYSKTIASGEVVNLIFQTGKYEGTQIIINVPTNLVTGKREEKYLNNDIEIATAMSEMGIPSTDSRMFVTKALKNGGHAKLYKLLMERKEDGLYQKLFAPATSMDI